MDKEQQNKFDELYRLVDISAKARYRASDRLSRHGVFSQWTLSLLAIGLIIVSVVSLSDIKVNFLSNYIDVMQIIFSVMVLTYSLLLGMGNFNARSEKLHRCGMELSRVLRRIKPYKGEEVAGEDSEYSELSRSYYDCLEKYENHKDVDFLTARLSIERRKGFPEKIGNESRWSFVYHLTDNVQMRAFMNIGVFIRNFLSFSHYMISLMFMCVWIYLLVK